MRSDGDALLHDFQRPRISRRSDIGAWGSVMSTISYLAVISNSFIIGFTSAAAYELLVDVDGESSSIEERCGRDLETSELYTQEQICDYFSHQNLHICLRGVYATFRYTRHELWAAVIVAEHIMLLGKLMIETSFSTVPNRVKRCATVCRYQP